MSGHMGVCLPQWELGKGSIVCLPRSPVSDSSLLSQEVIFPWCFAIFLIVTAKSK